jgi:uncharacterized caspase-like protein
MTIATAIADLEAARAERQDEIDAIDAALRELRMIRSGGEGPHQQPASLPSSQAKGTTAAQTSAAPSLAARPGQLVGRLDGHDRREHEAARAAS